MNIQQLKGIGEKTAALLSRLSVYTVKDLVGLYPRAYDVYEKPVFVQEAVEEHVGEYLQPLFFKEKKGRKKAPYSNQLTQEEIDRILDRAVKQTSRYQTMKAVSYTHLRAHET